MNRKQFNLLGWVAAALILIFIIVVGIRHIAGATPAHTRPAAGVCTDQACIKITEQDGTTYTLNDFKLIQNHCVLFISLPDGGHREACGNWHMDWIGPQ